MEKDLGEDAGGDGGYPLISLIPSCGYEEMGSPNVMKISCACRKGSYGV